MTLSRYGDLIRKDMIDVEKIQPGKTFGSSKQGGRREVVSVKFGVVDYKIKGVFSLTPLRMPLVEFAAWAEWEADGSTPS